ncbi:hypothetical protein [Simkania sp.]|uniref:hypothetical protein n=1 Tax=Simkania sp. TaxID=34094 RepID=UPI003B521514
MSQGIITGTNARYEWMLKLWWHYYSQTNTYPVTFMDFGMSKSARLWCESKGDVITISPPKGVPTVEEKIDPSKKREWEVAYKNPWESRKCWFYKPFAFLKTPYEQTLWLDIDTFVIKPLSSLFELDLNRIALTQDCYRSYNPTKLLPEEVSYATSIVGYTKNHPLIEKWAQKAQEWSHLFLGDQEILSRLICEDKAPITPLSPIFNAKPRANLSPDTFIVHFGSVGKSELYRKIFNPQQFK